MKDIQKDVLDFWFNKTQPALWFQTNPEFDAAIRENYADACDLASRGVYDEWRNSSDGCLALCLLLDQFPRNIYRGTPRAYATDSRALVIAKYALAKGFDQVQPQNKRRFIYRPLQHSENLNDQRKCVELFEKMKKDDPLSYDYALRHLKVIEKYNRFPQRNKILARINTPDEEEFLAQSRAAS